MKLPFIIHIFTSVTRRQHITRHLMETCSPKIHHWENADRSSEPHLPTKLCHLILYTPSRPTSKDTNFLQNSESVIYSAVRLGEMRWQCFSLLSLINLSYFVKFWLSCLSASVYQPPATHCRAPPWCPPMPAPNAGAAHMTPTPHCVQHTATHCSGSTYLLFICTLFHTSISFHCMQ